MVILGGDPLDGGETNKFRKRRWKEIMSVASTSAPKEGPTRPHLAFGYKDLLDGTPNKYVPLLITGVMANLDVRRILIGQGSSVDIIFLGLLKVLNIFTEDLTHTGPLN